MNRKQIISDFHQCFPKAQTDNVDRLVGADWLHDQGLTVESTAVRRGDIPDETGDFARYDRLYPVMLRDTDTGEVHGHAMIHYLDGSIGLKGLAYREDDGGIGHCCSCSLQENSQGDTWGLRGIEQRD